MFCTLLRIGLWWSRWLCKITKSWKIHLKYVSFSSLSYFPLNIFGQTSNAKHKLIKFSFWQICWWCILLLINTCAGSLLSNSEWSYPQESMNSNSRITLVDMLIKVKIVADCFHVLKAFQKRFLKRNVIASCRKENKNI